MAIGRVIWSDEYSTSVDSFVAKIWWISDKAGWYYVSGGLSVARTVDDEVMVDWWLPYPSEIE